MILIEFDHQPGIALDNDEPSRNHIHTVVRTPNGNDYGKDLLRQHYAAVRPCESEFAAPPRQGLISRNIGYVASGDHHGRAGSGKARPCHRQPHSRARGCRRRLWPCQHAPSEDPNRYLLSRSRSPELVGAEDMFEFTLDGKVVSGDGRPPYLERFIHGAIYEARPEVMGVVHSHAEDMLPYGLTDVQLKPVIHSGSVVGNEVRTWDIAR